MESDRIERQYQDEQELHRYLGYAEQVFSVLPTFVFSV